ncbi:MAG: response regulator, partial [Desulfobacteraceae bacterium]|nr:response regulator [Desulfobacteraceae bacterium]
MSKTKQTYQLLIVDDEEGIRKVLKITLEHSGYKVFLASDGEAGLKIFKKIKPQIVITDIKMPGVDGIALLKAIKEIAPETEVIMITGHGDMDLAVTSLQYEAADFITKPIDNEELELSVEKAVERIFINQKIKTYMDDLEHIIEEKDRKLSESEKLVTIGHTIAGMSHAIKNIAGGLKGSSFILEQGIAQENREYLKQGWEMMKGNINKITNLSLDLLNYAKTTQLVFKPVDPNKPVREVKDLMEYKASEKEVDFDVVTMANKEPVHMDADAIHSAILNLVTNAFDAMNTSWEDARQKRVSLKVQAGSDHILYTVKDNGCGMNKNIKNALFKEFITTKGSHGTGFGLMTTKKIIQEHK